MKNSIISPQSMVVLTQMMASGLINDGESPNFVASVPAFPGFQGYCTMVSSSLLCTNISNEFTNSIFVYQSDPTVVANSGSPPLLAFNGKADAFSLCTNTSANARVDVIFSPVTGHPHYVLDDCKPVSIQVITS
jgi:hypothetical protein